MFDGPDPKLPHIDLMHASSTTDLELALERLAGELGFEFFFVRCFPRRCVAQGLGVAVGNYPDTWHEAYEAEGLRRIDPVLKYVSHFVRPVRLEDLPIQVSEDAPRQRFLALARDCGIFGGACLPLNGPDLWGYLNFNAALHQVSDGVLARMALIAPALVETLRRLFIDETVASRYAMLTLRERETLYWASRGKTAWETSKIMDISQRTVTAHITGAATKMACVNKVQLLALVADLLTRDIGLGSLISASRR